MLHARRCAFALSFFATVLASSVTLAADGWTDNVAEAMKQAAAEKKDLLLDFTGSDWCGWCIKLHEEVFEKEPFKSEAPKKFVLVTLDFPQDKSQQSKATIKQNEEWEKKLSPEGYPSIYLTDERGIPYAVTGYEEGGPEKYLAHLKELADVRTKRDAALATAAKAEGPEKAKALDTALTAVGEDLALAHYGDTVKEILTLDAENKAGLKAKYEQLQHNHEALEALAKLEAGMRKKPNFEKLVKQVDDILEQHKPLGAARIQVLFAKVGFLGHAKKHEEAIQLLDELVGEKSLEAEVRHELLASKVSLLSDAERPEEALKVLGELLADKSLTPEDKLAYTLEQTTLLVELKREEEALKTLNGLLAGLDPKSEERLLVLVQKAELLTQLGKPDDAKKVYDEAIAAAPDDETKQELKQAQKQLDKPAAKPGKKQDQKPAADAKPESKPESPAK